MSHDDRLTTAVIQQVFAEEIAALGGNVKECFDDGECLFVRSVLPRTREVLPGDRFQDGIALRATDGNVSIHPYVFRQVCSNGAIIAHAVQTERIEGIDSLPPDQAAWRVREGVRACCAEEAFEGVGDQMRSASEVQVDRALNLMPFLSRLSGRKGAARLFGEILDRFFKDADSSRFGLMNAVTSVARDTSDPDARWRLEELGGEVMAGRPLSRASVGSRAERPAEVSLIS